MLCHNTTNIWLFYFWVVVSKENFTKSVYVVVYIKSFPKWEKKPRVLNTFFENLC